MIYSLCCSHDPPTKKTSLELALPPAHLKTSVLVRYWFILVWKAKRPGFVGLSPRLRYLM
jgi:hypothetical protein